MSFLEKQFSYRIRKTLWYELELFMESKDSFKKSCKQTNTSWLEVYSDMLLGACHGLSYPGFLRKISFPRLVWDLFIFPDIQFRIPLLPFVWVTLWLLKHVSCIAGTLPPPSCNMFILEEQHSMLLVRSQSIESSSQTKNRNVSSLKT